MQSSDDIYFAFLSVNFHITSYICMLRGYHTKKKYIHNIIKYITKFYDLLKKKGALAISCSLFLLD
jgi:hypothetical protein